MDDEGQNKNPNDSGAPQGIFSTPELTVDTEKVNQASAASEEKARSRVASIFANTETGKQAQRLNDAMGMNSQPVDGDIVIDNRDQKKRSKVPIIVAVVVLVLAGVGVGIWALINNFGEKRGESGISDLKPLDVAYGNYMDYLISGKEGSDKFSMNDLPEDYSLQNPYSLFAESVIAGIDDSVDRNAYLSKLAEKYDIMAKAYSAANNGEELSGAIADYFDKYANITSVENTNFLQLYQTLGKEGVQQIIDSRYDSSLFGDSMKTYMENQRTIANYQLMLAEVALENGCVSDGEVQEGCMQANLSKLDKTLAEDAARAYLSTGSIVLDLRSEAMNELARIANQITKEEGAGE